MTNHTSELNRASTGTDADLNRAIANADKAVAEVAVGGAAQPGRFEDALDSARAHLAGAIQPAVDRSREAAAGANRYVHENPWALIGAAAAVGLLIGFLAARR